MNRMCPNCGGQGEAIYYVETARDEKTVTLKRKLETCHLCNGSGKAPKTNADRIRAMSDEELAKFLEEVGISGCPDPARSCRASCTDCMMEWLQQPAEGD